MIQNKLEPDTAIIGCDARVLDFWAWAFSDVLSNTTRAVFAEFLVGRALGILDSTRKEWDYTDLQYGETKIEVKATGASQSWKGEESEALTFKIPKTKGWHADTNEYGDTLERSADVYVFAVFKGASVNEVLDVSKWRFLVMPTAKLNELYGDQKTVRLSVLERKGGV